MAKKEKKLTKEEKAEMTRGLVVGLTSSVMSLSAGFVIEEAIAAILPAPIKAGTKIVRAIGGATISYLVETRVYEVVEGAYDDAVEALTEARAIAKEKAAEKQKAKEEKKSAKGVVLKDA